MECLFIECRIIVHTLYTYSKDTGIKQDDLDVPDEITPPSEHIRYPFFVTTGFLMSKNFE